MWEDEGTLSISTALAIDYKIRQFKLDLLELIEVTQDNDSCIISSDTTVFPFVIFNNYVVLKGKILCKKLINKKNHLDKYEHTRRELVIKPTQMLINYLIQDINIIIIY